MREKDALVTLASLDDLDNQALHTFGHDSLTNKFQHSVSETRLEPLFRTVEGHPELRQQLSSKARSNAVRQRLLRNCGDRSHGSDALNRTHAWRKTSAPPTLWQKLKNPVLRRAASYSFGKAVRVASRTIEQDQETGLGTKYGVPGPGTYHRTKVGEHSFPAQHAPHDSVSLGANHPMPWKDVLGQQINPVQIDATSVKVSSKKYSFSRARRILTDVQCGAGSYSAKSDEANLSPGYEYNEYTLFGPPHRPYGHNLEPPKPRIARVTQVNS